MARTVSLEEFGLFEPERHSDKGVPEINEDEKLEAFERGYTAGWEDASKAQMQDSVRVSAVLESNLRDLSFTFHEARSHILQGLEPLFEELIEKILPDLAKSQFPVLISARLAKVVKEGSDRPVVLSCAPDTVAAVESILPEDLGFSLSVREETTLGDGQVFLNLGSHEESIDLDDSLAAMRNVVRDFFDLNERTLNHG